MQHTGPAAIGFERFNVMHVSAVAAFCPLLIVMSCFCSQSSDAQSGDDMCDQSVKHSVFIYEDAPTPQCHASTIEQLRDGTLVAAWFGGTHEKHKDVGIWVSRSVDESWTKPVEVANGVQFVDAKGNEHRHPCWNPVLFQPNDGPLMLFYKCGPTPSSWWGMLMTSEDDGVTWSQPRRLPEGIAGPVKNKPVELEDGAILCPTSSEDDGWRVHFEITRDHGRTWMRIGPIHDGQTIGAIQPSILFHGESKISALGRTRNGSIFQTWSDDNGITWRDMAMTNLPNPNAGTDAVTLRDGRHLLVYNHTLRNEGSPRNREMLNIAISEDGKAWHAALVLENTPKSEFSYPAVIQTDDGMVHITYTWNRRRVKHVAIDPSKLSTEPIVDGRWPESIGLAAVAAEPGR